VGFDLGDNLAERHVARSFRSALAKYLAEAPQNAPEVSRTELEHWWQGVRQ
jgi:hypothetical protein